MECKCFSANVVATAVGYNDKQIPTYFIALEGTRQVLWEVSHPVHQMVSDALRAKAYTVTAFVTEMRFVYVSVRVK